ncbi:MAG: 4Fe-4S dicluster domain-containing protein [Proteobacteria bacterium]|nr:4Fe-4S dicluster domain-containing protein [Pseudomonadota bacterium]
MRLNRRDFLIRYGCGLVAGAGAVVWRSLDRPDPFGHLIRPPGALPESQFIAACIRCGQCVAVCPRGSITTLSATDSLSMSGIPYIDTRKRACNLCMRCGAVCPTGALQAIVTDKSVVAKSVSMGVAVIDKRLCISFLGRMCGLCRDACPFPGEAIKLEPWARPVIIDRKCVGCGLCVEICPQQPTAIRIDPHRRRFATK